MFFNNDKQSLIDAAKTYHKNNENGRFILAVAVFAADTREEAIRQVDNLLIVKVQLASGRTVTVLDEETAEKFGEESGEEYKIDVQKQKVIAGTAADIKKELDALHKKLNVDEFILHTPIINHGRLRSFELLSPNKLFAETKSMTMK